MALAATHSVGEPLSELNTTPLIDVLLVLLVMMIITIPIATHSLPVDLPSGEGPVVQSVQNEISIRPDGTPTWNGQNVSRAQLGALLSRTASMVPEPTTLFRPDPQASYNDAAQIIQLVQRAGITKFAFVGNEQHRSFGTGD